MSNLNDFLPVKGKLSKVGTPVSSNHTDYDTRYSSPALDLSTGDVFSVTNADGTNQCFIQLNTDGTNVGDQVMVVNDSNGTGSGQAIELCTVKPTSSITMAGRSSGEARKCLVLLWTGTAWATDWDAG